jgi:hypothetical protein
MVYPLPIRIQVTHQGHRLAGRIVDGWEWIRWQIADGVMILSSFSSISEYGP